MLKKAREYTTLLYFCLGRSETCVRQIPNLSIQGVPSLGRVPVGNARECIVVCIERKAECKASVYSLLANKDRVCQLFGGNSNYPGAKLLPLSTASGDATNLYEILNSCAGEEEETVPSFSGGEAKPGAFDLRLSQWANWEEWSSCTQSCDQRRTRKCTNCPGSEVQIQQQIRRCDSSACLGRRPLAQGNDNIEWSSWGVWTECQQYCGGIHPVNQYRHQYSFKLLQELKRDPASVHRIVDALGKSWK